MSIFTSLMFVVFIACAINFVVFLKKAFKLLDTMEDDYQKWIERSNEKD